MSSKTREQRKTKDEQETTGVEWFARVDVELGVRTFEGENQTQAADGERGVLKGGGKKDD